MNGMAATAILFTLFMIVLFVGACTVMGVFVGPLSGIAFLVSGVVFYRVVASPGLDGGAPRLRRDRVNAFQRSLSDD